jgi:hypothetical protein
MAGEKWQVVTFNEGAPLDANDLNQLQSNLTSVYQTSDRIKNSLSSGSDQEQSLLISAGSIPNISVSKNIVKLVPLPIDSKFGTKIPNFVVSLGSDLANTEQVSVGVRTPATSPQVAINSSIAKTSLVINYIAFLIQ